MTSVPDLALATISQAQRRVEVAAQNLANVGTTGYKRRVAFASLLASAVPADVDIPNVSTAVDFRKGKLVGTGNAADLAISGPGYFAIRKDDVTLYSRQGQFQIGQDGRLVNDRGFALQAADGDDLKVRTASFQVDARGTVLENGQSLGRIATYVPEDENKLEIAEGGFRAGGTELHLQEDVSIQQGFLEASNVSSGDEMVSLMESLRRAEAGQRVMNVYDDLMGRAITSFGEIVR